jgi:hypothetical protein
VRLWLSDLELQCQEVLKKVSRESLDPDFPIYTSLFCGRMGKEFFKPLFSDAAESCIALVDRWFVEMNRWPLWRHSLVKQDNGPG